MKKRIKSKALGQCGICKESSAFLCSSREITICGCEKVLHYGEDTVRLLLCDGIMEISGRGLCAVTYFGREIKLSGKICSVRLLDSIDKKGEEKHV